MRPRILVALVVLFATLAFSSAIPYLPTPFFEQELTKEMAAVINVSVNELITLFLFAEFSRESQLSIHIVYGIGASGRSAGAVVGSMLGPAVSSISTAAANGLMIISLVIIAQVITAAAFVLLLRPIDTLVHADRWESPIGQRCEQLAARYGLTPREAEVMELLAKGRSIDWICEHLHIAKGTATVHAHHIYKKLGIHSKQQLLDLVDHPNNSS